MRPELYISKKGEGSRSTLENMVSLYNMRRNLTDTNLSFPLLMQKEKKNEKKPSLGLFKEIRYRNVVQGCKMIQCVKG